MSPRGEVATHPLPTLMFHEVGEASERTRRNGLPDYYCIPPNLFRRQLQSLRESGYRTVHYRQAGGVPGGVQRIVITFDDGWQGNLEQAVPILREVGFTAVFFLSLGSVGCPGYLTWDGVRRLLDAGMTVQSHAISHRPLETLGPGPLAEELGGSKRILEERLGQEVDAISFPHGSYNPEIVALATDKGFRFCFTSDIGTTSSRTFATAPRVIARIPVTNALEPERLIAACSYRGARFQAARLASHTKRLLRRAIGIDNYRRIYRLLYRVSPGPNSGLNPASDPERSGRAWHR